MLSKSESRVVINAFMLLDLQLNFIADCFDGDSILFTNVHLRDPFPDYRLRFLQVIRVLLPDLL